jgi:hypothetical protein
MSLNDPLDDYITAAAAVLELALDPAWRPGVRANFEVTLRLGRLVEQFELPDDAEPAPIFRA